MRSPLESFSDEESKAMYGITNSDLDVAYQLFSKLSKKSLKLLKTVNNNYLHMFPEIVRENQTVKEKFDSSHPLSASNACVLVNNGAAYSVGQYRKLFVPELYLSLIYSFGCRLTNVFHEFLVQTNGLSYLPNDDYENEDDKHMKKDAQVHVRNLEIVIDRYQQLLRDQRAFFEMGILKKAKDDTYSKQVCYQMLGGCVQQEWQTSLLCHPGFNSSSHPLQQHRKPP